MSVKVMLKVYDEKGKLIRKQEARSWLRNFFRLLCGYLRNDDRGMIATGGSGFTARTSADGTDGDHSIQLGTGSTPPAFTDYKLASFLAGLTMTREIVAIEGGYKWRFYGTYTPTTVVDIYEIAFNFDVYDIGGTRQDVILLRDVFSPPIHHEPGQSRTYAIEVEIKA